MPFVADLIGSLSPMTAGEQALRSRRSSEQPSQPAGPALREALKP